MDNYHFAIGSSINSNNDLLTKKLNPEYYLPPKNENSFKVLIHYEGGWPLKTFPINYLNELVKLFFDKGFRITVLSSKINKNKYYNVVKYTNLSDFKTLIASHNLLIGMDSFPVHYGAHAAGIPTICLFGNTKPVNSDSRLSKYYNYVTGDLQCVGCFGFDKCPVNNKITCDNFPKPAKVYETAISMLDGLYNTPEIAKEEKDAVDFINSGKYNEAIQSIESVSYTKPDSHDTHFLLGKLYDVINNPDKAIFHYKTAATLDPENILYEINVADYYNFRLDKVDEALGKYLNVLRKQPSNTKILILVGNILATNGHIEEASKYYSKALTFEPGNQIAIENMMNLTEMTVPIQ